MRQGTAGSDRRRRRRAGIDAMIMAVAAMGALSVSATVPHEAGHIAVCAAGGHDYRMLLGPMGPVVECSPVPTHLWLYRAMGGAAGAAFLAALFAWPRVRRSAPWRSSLP